ncbi:IclR family transcriptional regulator [Clostridium tarantellae]|uniref:Glycerol operon regulatory protein n=1 Tax=Clostridium tarantellae TaxID=39493 RepID=A0A6I1MNM4_9CLOT|nr:IclR family transcriptional regulator [Clostridium tarantellae]MPQ44078.1 helix-turn-helix domain-containing protein [Clostridium tarantellae]
MSDKNLVQSVERALNILETLAEHPKGYGITQISKDLGLSKATVHRLISTLKSKNFVHQSEDSEQYMLGYKVLYLSNCLTRNLDLIKVSHDYIQKFSNEVDETVHLSTLDENLNNIVYIDKIEPEKSKKSFIMSSKIGKTAPAYCTAAGRLLLSQYTDEKIKEILKNQEFKSFTLTTPKNIDEVIKEIHYARLNGYAFDNMEYDDGVICISVPILGNNNRIVAAMSVSGLSIYSTKNDLLKLKPLLDTISSQITTILKCM